MINHFLIATVQKGVSLLIVLGAGGIQRVNINRVTFTQTDGKEMVRKRRVSWSWILIGIGNALFQFRRPAIRVLPTREWVQWEHIIMDHSGNTLCSEKSVPDKPSAQSKDVKLAWLTDKISGETLSDLLHRKNFNETEKLQFVAIAAQALLELHQRTMDLELLGGSKRLRSAMISPISLSHADATAPNIMVELKTGVARWFDFDLQHDLCEQPTIRHADDLRALLFSSVYCCRWNCIPKLVDAVQVAYPTDKVWLALAEQLSDRRFRFDIFHQAQIRRSLGGHRAAEPKTLLADQEAALVAAILARARCSFSLDGNQS